MERKTKWRTFWLCILVALAVMTLVPSFIDGEFGPFKQKIQYGLDLQGGLHIVYSIDLNKAVDDKSTELKRDMEAQLVELSIKGKVITPQVPVGSVYIILEDSKNIEQMKTRLQNDYVDVITDLECPENENKANSICVRVSSDFAEGIKKSALEQAILTVRERISGSGVSNPPVFSKGDQIIVELPGLDESEIDRVKEMIKRTAKLEFKIVDEAKVNNVLRNPFMQTLYGYATKDPTAKEAGITVDTDSWSHQESGRLYEDFFLKAEDRDVWLSYEDADDIDCLALSKENDNPSEKKRLCTLTGRQVLIEYLAKLAVDKPEQFKLDDEHAFGYEFVKSSDIKKKGFWRSYYLLRAVELSGSAVQSAVVSWDTTTNKPLVLIDFNRWGGRRFGELTGQNIGRKMTIILDDKISSAPTIQTRIDGGSSSITMGGSNVKLAQAEAKALVNVLRTGSLPAPLRVDSESKVGPLLGGDAVDKAKIAFILGSLLVILIMIIYYRTSGIISIAALALNILFMMAILATFGASLTLPGIAALVLTVGMAVDANIIIYERIREELRAGKSVKGSVEAGFGRGFAAILDGQLTTGVAGYVLYQYGSGPIKGFAVMLMIGIICTLFSATWVTRLFFEHYIGGKGRKTPTIAI